MALPITIPNTFATETTNIPLSDLDANFTTVANAINGIGSGSEALANVDITGGTIDGAVIGGASAAAGTFTTLTATTANITTLNVTGGGGVAPTGSVTMWAGAIASPPSGWLACNGATVSRAAYANLFAVIGTMWGAGDGSTTFTLPNLLNRFPVGAGDTYNLAATGGSANAVVVSHNHTATSVVTDPGHFHQTGIEVQGDIVFSGYAAGNREPIDGTNYYLTTDTKTTGVTVATTVATSGSSGTNANLPPYVGVGFIIKT